MGSDYKPYTIDMSPETPGPHDPDLSPASPCTPGELYRCLAWLGLRSAGGTLGQVEMLRRELVLRRPWLDDAAFSDLLAFSQSIPGPSSLQMVAALGALWGGGLRGAIGSSLVFSAPSVVVLYILRDPRAIVSQFFTEFGPIVSVEAPIAFMAEVAVGMAPACVGLVLYSAWRSLHALGADRTRRGVAVAAALAMLLVSPLGAPVAIPALVVGGALLATLASSLERTPLLTLKIPTLLRFSARKSRVQRDRERERERERDWDKHSLAENGWWPIPAALCVGSFLGWLLFVVKSLSLWHALGNIGGPYCWVPSYTSKFPHFNETCLSWHNYQVDLHPISF
eukprot:jgi/Mesen1/10163/ME000076S09668